MRPGGKPKTVQMVRQGAANAASFLFEVTIKKQAGRFALPLWESEHHTCYFDSLQKACFYTVLFSCMLGQV